MAVELCESRKASLLEPDALDNEDLLKILNDGKSHMILLQSALAAEQRRMGISLERSPGQSCWQLSRLQMNPVSL